MGLDSVKQENIQEKPVQVNKWRRLVKVVAKSSEPISTWPLYGGHATRLYYESSVETNSSC